MDVPFPKIDPSASEEDLAALAKEFLGKMVESNLTAAIVQGEFTFTFLLVSGLERLGVPCYAATTKRVAEVEQRRDETWKSSQFEFVQFRRYQEYQGHALGK